MLKGHTKIILTDVETGKEEVHEDDNLITNAIDKIINIEMAMNHAPNDQLLPIATKLLGGIMLFDGALTESVDNIHFPTEAHIVGYANGSVNTTDNYRGSYNTSESGKTIDGYTSVWDFGTSQANGTIKAVARTHNQGGACPFYNYVSSSYTSTGTGAPATDTYWYPIRYDGTYLYMMKNNSSLHQMRLARVKIPRLSMGVGDYSNVERTYEVIATWDTLLTEYTYYNSESDKKAERNPYTQYVYADSPYMYKDGHDGYLYCLGYKPDRSYTEYNYDLTYFTIKYEDGSYTKSETVRKNIGVSSYRYVTNGFGFLGFEWGHVHKGTIYFLNGTRKCIHIVPLDNVAAYKTVRILSDDTSDYITNVQQLAPHEGGVYFEIYHYTESSYEYRFGILYPDGVYVTSNQSYAGTNSWHGNPTIYDCVVTEDDDLTTWFNARDTYCYCGWMANYLGTINNLGSPITKTAAQTMKIIYTLRDTE